MKKIITAIIFLGLSLNLFSQNINGKLGLNGQFIIRDTTNTFLTLPQNTGYLNLNRSLVLPNTTGSTLGVMYKGADRFIHNYQAPGTNGQNVFIGINSGNFTMSGSSNQGSFNTGVGSQSLSSLTTGAFNSAFGTYSLLSNTAGVQNSAFGTNSLRSNTTGNYNSAFGSHSLYSNTTGDFNSAFGFGSLYSNTAGSQNSAFGRASLYSNMTGYENSALGYYSLFSNTDGWHNTAVGFDALRNNVSGFQNTAVGHHSLQNNTGNFNTAIGYNSGSTVTSGSNLTLVGIDANPTSPTATNQITLGNQFVTSLRCNVTTITSLSDRRDKSDIEDLSLGLDFIAKLKPRQFNWDRREWYEDGISDGNKKSEAPTAGFIAQELDSAQINANAEWLNLVLKDNPEKWEATPGNLLPVMIKAIQELNEKCDALQSENNALKTQVSEMNDIKNKLTGLTILIEEIKLNNKEIKLTEK